jgi:hypothetical protein
MSGRPDVRRRGIWATAVVLWLGSMVAGLAWLAHYDNDPGTAATAPDQWPAQSRIARDSTRPTLVMLAHPRCDCTRASLAELAELMARAHQRPKAYVVFIKPGRTSGNWEQTALWKSAAQIADVTVVRDDDGREAKMFGAVTSGQTLLYDADGRLLFSGGTTGSRGHVGDNAGRASILALLNGAGPHLRQSPVFGCSLFGPGDDAAAATHEGSHGS